MSSKTPGGDFGWWRVGLLGLAMSGWSCFGPVSTSSAACLPVPAGVASWWPGEGDATDFVGGNAGTLQSGVGFAAGKVGQAFSFSGSAAVRIPAAANLNVGTGAGFTIEAWINPIDLANVPLFEWNDGSGSYDGLGVHLWQSQPGYGGPGSLFANVVDTAGATHTISSSPVIGANVFQHVALSYDKASGIAKLYQNGEVVALQTLGSFSPRTGFDLYLGRRPAYGSSVSFSGRIDEPSLFDRALSDAEIQTIYNSSGAGKCFTPFPPMITVQPLNQSVISGRFATIAVSTTGTSPLFFQWRRDGTNLQAATTSSLTFPSVQPGDTGTYSVVVTNVYGSATSTVANLAVVVPACSSVPAGVVSWWPGEGDATDVVGGNHGILQGGTGFGAGKAGQAFSFSGNAAVRIQATANLNVGAGAGFTIEAWINPANLSTLPLFEWSNGGGSSSDVGVHLWQSITGAGSLFGQIADLNGGPHTISSPAVLVANSNQHVALSYDKASGVAKIYHNGGIVAQTSLGSFTPKTATDLYLGRRASFQPIISFAGLIDEPALYNRALTDAEIQAIANADYAGKCQPVASPSILTQPQSQTVLAGHTVSFSVAAAGASPLVYQWQHNGTNLPAATTSSLVFLNAKADDAGTYSVVVTNGYGSATSAVANLAVVVPACSSLPPGVVSWWPGDGDATDVVGGNHGILQGGLGFGTGTVGQAFSFSENAAVRIPAAANLNVGAGAGFTVEAWISPANLSALPLFEWSSGGGSSSDVGVHFWQSIASTGSLFGQIVDLNGSAHEIASPAVLVANSNQHVALSYDKASGVAKIYHNGGIVAQTSLGSFTPKTGSDLYLGRRASFLPIISFAGLIDEPALYNRALTDVEIQAIFNADATGKCPILATPSILAQPQGQSVIAGRDASLSVVAVGTSPLLYQWQHNGTNLQGATTPLLTFVSAQLEDNGAYSVIVTNAYGSVTSATAVLSVRVPACFSPPSGIVGWWAGEGDVQDKAGVNHGIPQNGLAFVAGVAGQGFKFDGTSAAVRVPASADLDVGRSAGFTIEAWINPDNLSNVPLIEWNGLAGQQTDLGVHLWQSQPGYGGTGSLFANVIDAGGAYHTIYSFPVLVVNSNQHVALTYDRASGWAKLYHDGVVVGQANLGSFEPQTDLDLYLGRRPFYGGGVSFAGVIDEASVYDRALTDAEVQGIFFADYAGKCAVPLAPILSGQPQSLTAAFQSSAGFEVIASGRSPLRYQWFHDDAAIPGATNRSLPLPNVQPLNEGSYYAVVANPYGFATSSNATLKVVYPSRSVYVPGMTAASGTSISVPVRLVAAGDEHAVGFSLTFDPAVLIYAGVSPGSGAANATLIAATTGASNGHLGFALALPADMTFAPGTQEVLRVNFDIVAVTNSQIAAIGFSDQPMLRLLSDANINLLPATFIDGGIVIPDVRFEGDVSPRPNGDRNTTIFDWLQAGRFLVGLDALGSPGEFQRADCAPRATRGDGVLSLTDWVQAGRYAALFDPLTVAGGPTGPASFASFSPGGNVSAVSAGRAVQVADAAMVAGQPATVSVRLIAQGDENALEFTLGYDAGFFRCTGATAGAQAAGAALLINTNHPGKVAVLLALAPGVTFGAGTHEVVRIQFQVDPAAAGQVPLSLIDQPLPRAVADAQANALGAAYSDGVAVISLAPPFLRAVRVDDAVMVSWPGTAVGYVLDASDDPTQSGGWSPAGTNATLIGGEYRVAIDAVPEKRFFRLRRP